MPCLPPTHAQNTCAPGTHVGAAPPVPEALVPPPVPVPVVVAAEWPQPTSPANIDAKKSLAVLVPMRGRGPRLTRVVHGQGSREGRPAHSSAASNPPSPSPTRLGSRPRPNTLEPGSTELTSHTLPPITEPRPIT